MNWLPQTKLSELTRGPLTAADLKAYAEASLDFNPIHLDPAFAQQAGFPSVIVHGMLSMAFLGDLVSANFPPAEYRLEKITSRFKKVTFPGDRLQCLGEVKKVQENKALTVALRVVNQRGEVTTEGEATVVPLKLI